MLTAGNHEIEQQEDANYTTFASVRARWKVSATEMPKTTFMGVKPDISVSNIVDIVDTIAKFYRLCVHMHHMAVCDM